MRVSSVAMLFIASIALTQTAYSVEIIGVEAAPSTLSLTIDQISSLAQQENPQLAAAAEAVEAAKGAAQQAGLYPNPVLEGGANQLGGRDSQYYAMLSQEIVTKHKLGLDRAAATQEIFQAELDFIRTRFAILTAVRRDFYSALAAQRRVEILEELVRLLSQSHTTSERLRQAGEGTRADVLLLDVQWQQAEVSLQNARTLWEAAKAKLAASAGNSLIQIDRVEGDLTSALAFPEFHAARDQILQDNAQARRAMVEIDRTQILLQRAMVEPFPNVTVGAGYQANVEPLHNLAILQVAFPLPVWNRNQGNIRSARANVSRATQTLGAVQNDLARQLADAWGDYHAAQQQVARFENNILPASREAIRLAQQGYEQGEFDFLRLLQAQQTAVRTELEYVSSVEAKWLAAADLAGLLQLDQFPPQAESN